VNRLEQLSRQGIVAGRKNGKVYSPTLPDSTAENSFGLTGIFAPTFVKIMPKNFGMMPVQSKIGCPKNSSTRWVPRSGLYFTASTTRPQMNFGLYMDRRPPSPAKQRPSAFVKTIDQYRPSSITRRWRDGARS